MDIQKRGKSSYRLTVNMGYVDGRKTVKRKTVNLAHIKNEKKQFEEAQRLWYQFEADIEKGNDFDEKLTFAELSEKWLKEYSEQNHEKKTVFRYRELLNTRINPSIGHIAVAKLKPLHLIEFYNTLKQPGKRLDTKYQSKTDIISTLNINKKEFKQIIKDARICEETASRIRNNKTVTKQTAERFSQHAGINIKKLFSEIDQGKPLSGKTILHHHRVISSILQDAVQWQLIKENPATRVEPPKVDDKEKAVFNEEKAIILLSALENEPLKYKVFTYIAILTGMRRGEIVALEWKKHIDLETNTIKVRRAGQYISGEGKFTKTTKTKGSVRDVPIPDHLSEMLKKYKIIQNETKFSLGSLWNYENDFIFTTWNGNMMHPDTPSSWFVKFIKRHNLEISLRKDISRTEKELLYLPAVSLHGLRHTAATLLINKGFNIKALSGLLGHNRPSTTLDIYSHELRSVSMESVNIMEDTLKLPKKKKEKEKAT